MSSILDQPAIRNAALPISVEQYHQLGACGIIPTKTELLRGVIVSKMIKSPEHSWLTQRLAARLRNAVGAGFHVRREQPLTLRDSEPEPDVAVVAGVPDDFRTAHPTTAQLVVEVAITTVEVDRAKDELYAAAGVPEYWLVLPLEGAVEVYREPTPLNYDRMERVAAGQTLAAGPFPSLTLSVEELFGQMEHPPDSP